MLVMGLIWLISDHNGLKLGILFFFITGAFIAARFFRLKKVQLYQEVLYVSNYLRCIVIPLEDIARVEVSLWWEGSPRLATLHLRKCSAFGSRIVFIPRGWAFLASGKTDEISAAISARHNKALQLTTQ